MLRLRIIWLFLIAVLVVGSVTTPLRAANPTGQLAEAHKLMQNGAYVRAIEVIDASLSSGNMPSDMNGRALLMRAQCNEKLGKAAFALADYNQALWMEGLPAADKKAAEEGRKRVEGGLGLSSSGKGEATTSASVAVPPAAAKAAPKPAAGSAAAAAQTPPTQQQPKEEGGIGGFFNSIFGGSSQKEEAQPHRAVVAEVRPEQPRPASKPVKAVAVSTTNTAASPVRPVKVATNTAAPPPVSGTTAVTGEYAIQFAALLSEDLAIAEVNRIAKKFGSDLGGRSPSVVIVPTKDGGTLYKIVAGPYPKAEGVATCEILKAKNVNCMIISHKQQ